MWKRKVKYREPAYLCFFKYFSHELYAGFSSGTLILLTWRMLGVNRISRALLSQVFQFTLLLTLETMMAKTCIYLQSRVLLHILLCSLMNLWFPVHLSQSAELGHLEIRQSLRLGK